MSAFGVWVVGAMLFEGWKVGRRVGTTCVRMKIRLALVVIEAGRNDSRGVTDKADLGLT